MKYMGSKRSMLRNGLGDALDHAVATSNRVFDLFTGSGAVAWHVAQKYDREVIAADLQAYAVVLAASVIERTEPLGSDTWLMDWLEEAQDIRPSELSDRANQIQSRLGSEEVATSAASAQDLCRELANLPISAAYGGYFFSPQQSLWLDTLRESLPSSENEKKVALAALVIAASKAAAAPGHTAQPFKANSSAGRYLIEAWSRDIPSLVSAAVREIGKRHSLTKGKAKVGNANDIIREVKEGDLVFVDPPYSGIHYSRFYHVLETVARGQVGQISGIGRYPPRSERPRSDYSLKTRSKFAFRNLLQTLSNSGASAIITFPAGNASNGMSGDDVTNLAEKHFLIKETEISTRFSTLGGDKRHRAARQDTIELILQLSPR